METEILTIDGTPSRGLWPVVHGQEEEVAETLSRHHRPAAETILDDFVGLLRDNPKVWAVYATEDPSGITVWTYIDSTDRNDRLPVYESEWRLLNMYPEVGFDFNTAMVPAGDEQFDDVDGAYLYRR